MKKSYGKCENDECPRLPKAKCGEFRVGKGPDADPYECAVCTCDRAYHEVLYEDKNGMIYTNPAGPSALMAPLGGTMTPHMTMPGAPPPSTLGTVSTNRLPVKPTLGAVKQERGLSFAATKQLKLSGNAGGVSNAKKSSSSVAHTGIVSHVLVHELVDRIENSALYQNQLEVDGKVIHDVNLSSDVLEECKLTPDGHAFDDMYFVYTLEAQKKWYASGYTRNRLPTPAQVTDLYELTKMCKPKARIVITPTCRSIDNERFGVPQVVDLLSSEDEDGDGVGEEKRQSMKRGIGKPSNWMQQEVREGMKRIKVKMEHEEGGEKRGDGELFEHMSGEKSGDSGTDYRSQSSTTATPTWTAFAPTTSTTNTTSAFYPTYLTYTGTPVHTTIPTYTAHPTSSNTAGTVFTPIFTDDDNPPSAAVHTTSATHTAHHTNILNTSNTDNINSSNPVPGTTSNNLAPTHTTTTTTSNTTNPKPKVGMSLRPKK